MTEPIVGGGRTCGDERLARRMAIAEALERYVGGAFPSDRIVTAAYEELGEDAIDPSSMPRCSPTELAHPSCPRVDFDPRAPIRWIRGHELVSAREIYVPYVSAVYRQTIQVPEERFAPGISTGYAVHETMMDALFGSISEIVERDMVAVLWHQMLPIPRLEESALGSETKGLVAHAAESYVETHLFDATSDVGLPTVYCVQRAPYDESVRTVVGAGTGLDHDEASYKALLEAWSVRGVLRGPWEEPESFSAFKRMEDGPRYTGATARADEAFAFLLDDVADRARACPRSPFASNRAEGLKRLVARFREMQMQVIALDRTTSELSDVGLVAASVVIPALQPLAFSPLAQFRGHPRLYDLPARLGYPVRDECGLNPFPQPFG